jgi:hypothetical protein
MNKYSLIILFLICTCQAVAQPPNNAYPNPEFANEVYLYRKDSAVKLLRLEKNTSKMDTKTKMGGIGGAESGYTMDGEKSPVRFSTGQAISFIYSNSSASASTNPAADSTMRANGLDPAMMQGMGSMSDPATMITLYKVDPTKGKRKIYLAKSGGYFGGGKNKSSDKFTFSVKKIREGYWELVIDKPLKRGEYSFSMMGTGMNAMDVMLYSFAID